MRTASATALLWVMLLAMTPLSASPIAAADYGYSPRQYYGGWEYHSQQKYYYRKYYYKPYHNYGGYRHHYVIHFPARKKYHYFYNPYKKVYWGRCPSTYGDEPTYSLLEEEHRKPTLGEIEESHFPEPGALPPIPESKDGFKIDLPPDDLPKEPLPSGE